MEKAMKEETLIVTKMAKGKEKQTDIRPLLISLSQASDGDPDSVEFYAFAGSERNVRPDLILSSLSKYCGMDPDIAENTRVIRTGLYSGEYPRIVPISAVEVRPLQPQD